MAERLRTVTAINIIGLDNMNDYYDVSIKELLKGETIRIFNYGNCKRDFTYIDDIVEGIKWMMQTPPEKRTGEDRVPVPLYAVYNMGNSRPESLLDFADILPAGVGSGGRAAERL